MAWLNSKGQAAVTDALYFLLVVTGVSVLLFSFANSYGNSVAEKITNNYNTTFSTDSLKAILYSSTPRDTTKSLYEGSDKIEVYHLLAFVKEDFSDDGALAISTKGVIAENIIGIMRPIATNFDYAFYISVPQPTAESKFVLLFLKVTDTDPATRGVHYYFCGEKPAGTFSSYRDLRSKLDKMFVSVGQTSAAVSRLKLSKVDATGTITAGTNAQVDLAIWSATKLVESVSTGTGNSYSKIDFAADLVWACESYTPQPPFPTSS